jgi:hypothetical protein
MECHESLKRLLQEGPSSAHWKDKKEEQTFVIT